MAEAPPRPRSLSSQFQNAHNLARSTRRGRGARQQEFIEAELVENDPEPPPPISIAVARMIRESELPDLLKLLPAADQSPAPASTGPSAAEAPELTAAAVQSGSNGTSWVRAFFAEDSKPGACRCLLAPEPGALSSQPHSATVSNDLTAMKRHVSDNTYHARSYAFFLAKVRSGLSIEAAARATLEKAAEDASERKLHFTKDPTGVKRLEAEIMLLCWVAEKGISFAAVESEYLKAYHDTYSWQHPPGRKRLSNEVLTTVYNLVLDYQREQLKEADFFSITTDSSTNYSHRFVSLTAHFVDSDWRLRFACLGVIPLDISHTWVNLTPAVSLRIEAALPSHATLAATVTDGGSNFLKLAASLHTNLEEAEIDGIGPDSFDEPAHKDLDLTAAWDCVAHRASLAALDVIDQVPGETKKLIGTVRDLIRHIRVSVALSVKLEALQRARLTAAASGEPVHPKKLQLDVATRWLSCHTMLSVFVQLYPDVLALCLTGKLDSYTGAIPSNSDVKVLRALVAALEPLAQLVRDCEGEDNYVSIALAPVLLARCMQAAAYDPEDTELVKGFKLKLRQRLRARLGHLLERPNLALGAAALHPGYGHLGFVTPAVRDQVWKELAVWASDFSGLPAPAPTGPGPKQPPSVRLPPEDFVKALKTLRESFEADQPEDPLELRDPKLFDPLPYWKILQAKSRHLWGLIPLAKMVFSVPATSAPSERSFSALNALVTEHRSSLLSWKREMLTVIRMHLKTTTLPEFKKFCLDAIASSKKRPKAA